MSDRCWCTMCLQMVRADDIHSCYDAKAVADHREAERDEVIRLREQLAAIDTLHKQWVIKFINGYERSKGVERLVDAIGKILHPQEREA